jgi:hypothetical protein
LLPVVDAILSWRPSDIGLLAMKTRLCQGSYGIFDFSPERLLSAFSALFDHILLSADKDLQSKSAFGIALLCEKCDRALRQPNFPMEGLITKVTNFSFFFSFFLIIIYTY